MKKITFILTLTLFTCVSLSAQIKFKGEKQKRMKAVKIAFITEKLDLTEEEAVKFWPLYNAYQKELNSYRFEERQKIKRQIGSLENLNNLSENEAKVIVENIAEIKNNIYKTEREFQQKLKGILDYKKILKLEIAEKEFHRKLINRLKHRRDRQ